MQELYLSEEIEALRSELRRFGREQIAPLAREADAQDCFPEEVLPHFRSMGLLSLPLPEKYGGASAESALLSVVLEEVAYHFATLGPVLLSTYTVLRIVDLAGTEAQRAAFFEDCVRRPGLNAFCLSEPHSGSDARAMKSEVRRVGNTWRLNGQKCWITNAGIAERYLVFCRNGSGREDISVFVVPGDAPGLRIGKKDRKMGLRGGPMASIYFDDVELSDDALVGSLGEGWRILSEVANTMRCWGAGSIALGIARAAFDIAARYAAERRQFGKAIGTFEGVGFKLADMAMAVRTAELLVRDTNWRVDREIPHPSPETIAQVSMAKCLAADTAMRVTLEAVQILGAYGYCEEASVERMMRDAKAFQILDGSNEIQRLIVSRHILETASRGKE